MRDAQVTINETSVVIDLGAMDIMFSKPTELDTDTIEVILYGNGETISGTVNSKTIMGALKALETSHDRRKANERGRERWESSMKQRQSLS